MTQRNDVTTQTIYSGSLINRMLLGAGIDLVVILFFVLGADEPKPEWGKLWMIRPLIVTPFAGAMAGLFNHLMDHLRYQGGAKKIVANVLSVVVYFFALWMGTVLGLAGTMWN